MDGITYKTYNTTTDDSIKKGSFLKLRVDPDNPTTFAIGDLKYFFNNYFGTNCMTFILSLFTINEYICLKRRDSKIESVIKYKFKDVEIILENHILDTIELEDCVIILIDIASKHATHIPQNVYCYNAKGELVWQINPSNNMFGIKPDVEEYEFEKIAYQNNYLYVITGNIAFAIDIKTGKYISHNFM